MRPKHLIETIKFAVKNNENLLITGAPGVGKTEIVKQAISELGYELLIKHPVLDDPTDVKGFGTINHEKGVADFIPFHDMHKLIFAKERVVCFIDDLGQAPAAVQAAYMQLLHGGTFNGIKIPNCVSFIAATNRVQDRAAVSGILEPVKSRFTIIELNPDENDWTEWAMTHNMPPELISFIRFKASNHESMLYNFQPSKEMKNSSCPRTVAKVGNWLNMGLPKEIEFEVISGAAGEAFSTEFVAYLKIYRNLPNPDWVVKNPEKVEIPKEPSTLYALTGAVAFRANAENFENILKFANRLPLEFNVMMVKDIILKHKDILTATPAFTNWCLAHKNILDL